MKIARDGIMLCEDCMVYAVIGDVPEGLEASARVIYGVGALGQHLVPDYDVDTGEGAEVFSHHACDGCGSELSGSRYAFATLERE